MPIQWDDETLGVPQKQPVYDGIIWDDDIGIGDASKERGTLGAFAKTALRVPENLAAKTIAAVQGQKGASVVDRGVADRFVNWVEARNRKLAEEYEGTGDFIPGVISKRDVAELGPNLAFSGVSMAGTLGGMTAAAPIPVPGARIAGGLAGGATAAYRMDSYQVMNDWLEKVNQESIKSGLGPISKTEEEKFKKDMSALATEHGAWEAGPEGLANILELALLTAKNLPGVRWLPKGVAGKLAKGGLRFAGVTGVEELTETPTQMGQQIVESKAGMTDEAPREWTSGSDILKSAKEVLPQVLLLSGFMSAGGAAFRKATGTKEKDMPPSAEEETLSEAATLTNMIDEGMTTGGINGQPFTPEIATGIIREAYADKVLTGEDLDNFREKYPDLRPIVNDIIGEKVKAEINKEMEDADARGVLLGENKDVTAKELLTGKREKALTPEAHQGIIEAEMPASTEPTVEIGIEKLPEFSGSTEALTFGKDATPDQIKALKQRREVSLGKFEKLIATRALNKASIEVTKAQLDKEAIDALEILREHPEYLKKPAKEVEAEKEEKAGVKELWEMTLRERLDFAKKELGEEYADDYESLKSTFEKEHYSAIESYVKEGGKISRRVIDSLPVGKKEHFYKHYGRENIIDAERDLILKKIDEEASEKAKVFIEQRERKQKTEKLREGQSKLKQIENEIAIAQRDVDLGRPTSYKISNTEKDLIVKNKADRLIKAQNAKIELLKKHPDLKPQPPKLPKAKPTLPRTEEIKGEAIPEVTPKRPKVEVGNKFYVNAGSTSFGAEGKTTIEITKDYGKGTPKEDYPGIYRMDMSGWIEVKDLETGDKFPITRNDLIEIGIEGREAKPKVEKEKVEVTPREPIKPTGTKKTIYLPDNTSIETSYAVVDSNDIVSSHDNDLKINPAFPKELQPRDRGRKAMIQQVTEMVNKLNPERLGESTGVGSGAPIIGKDGIVESGNGRVIAIRKAYKKDIGRVYKQWLIDNAETFGLKSGQIKGMGTPILVRVRETDVDRVDFVKKANQDEVARMSPVETAKSDADRLTEGDIALFAPSEEGDISATSNHAFINKFIKGLGTTESAGFLTEEGRYTKQLIDRITAAIFYKAYQSNDLISMMAEEADPNIKNILNALTVAAPEYVKTRALNKTLGDTAIVDHIVGATQIISNTRNFGQSVEQFFKQMSMFEQVPEYTKEITLFIDKNKRSAKRQGEFFKRIAKKINDILVENKNIALPGMKHRDIDISEIIDDVIQQVEAKYEDKQRGLFAPDIERGVRRGERVGRGRTEAGVAGTRRGEIPETGRLSRKTVSELLSLPYTDQAYPSGNSNISLRKQIMKELTGKDLPISKVGVGTIRNELLKAAGITKEGKAIAEYEDEIRVWLKTLIEKPTGISEGRTIEHIASQEKHAKVYVPITRKEADALFDKGAAILVARFNIHGPETTGEEGYYMRLPVQGRVVSYNEREIKSLYEKYKKRHGGTESGVSITSGKTKQRDGRLSAEVRDEKAFATKGIADISAFEERWENKGVRNEVYESSALKNKIVLSKVIIPKGERGKGIGAEYMEELSAYADSKGKTIALTPSVDFGGTSVLRLKKFYKRFGFVENKGRNRDYAISETMYRRPKLFATKAIKPQDTITRADLKSIFAKMKNVMTGQDKDGNFFFKILGRPKVIIYTVDHIEGYINTSMGRIPVGSFLPGKMELKTEGVGPTADVGSLWHEFFHGLKRMGVISNNDNEALNRAIAKIKGIDEKSITEEDQAYYVGDTLLDWHNQKNLRIKRILKKIADFVNAIYEFVSRTRTARGVLADIETGRLIGKEVAGEKAGVLIPAFQQTAPYWYSQVVKAVEQKFPNKMFARSITNWIKKQGGKPVELEWLGLDEWLEGKNVVTKDELSEFLRANQVEVEEVEKKAEVPRERKLVEDFTNEQLRKVIEHKEIDIDLPVFDRNKAIEVINEEIDAGGSGVRRFIYEIAGLEQYDFGDQIVSETKFGQWQLPGEKENYKELLLTLPYRFGAKPQARISELNKKVEDYTATKEEQIELNRLLESRTAGEFKSPHYDEPNILAHVRFNERTDAEGNKVLFLEEVQSDWALEGRKSGYDKVRPGIIDPFTGEPFEAKFAGVPDMPFKENWYQVALKRMLRYASENGFDKVAWVTGKQTADRYDLSKQINIVQWDHNADGTFDISATSHDLAINPIEKSGLSQDELENLIGKEVAKKVVTHKGQTYKAPDGATSGELSGLDLKVGGEWATQLYDKMIPQYLKKFGKKWGAEVGEIDLGKREGVSAKEEQARQLAGEKPGAAFEENVIVQAITITPQMKQSAIREGMPMFQMAGEKAIGAPTKREGLFKQKGSSLDNEGMELNYTVHIDKHYGYDKNGKYKLIPDKIYYDDVGLNLHSDSLKGLKDEITKAKSIKETKQFATKPSIDYKEMLKKYQEAHTTPAEKAKQAKKSAKDYVKDFTVDYIKVLDRYEAKLKSAETKLEKIKTSKEILKRRRGFIRAAADYFNLSDKELRQISGKDIRFMNNLEFKQYIDGIRIKAEKFEVRRQAMNELMTQIRDKELNVENLRKAMKLPTLKNMTVAQIQHLDETLVPYQKGDEFLTVRKLEVVDRTELEGIKTWREAREHLAKEISKQEGRTVTVKELQNIKVSEFDRFRYDTGLAEKDPFYKMMIEKPAKRMLVSETEYLKMEQEVFALAKEIKGKGFFVPQYKNIMRWMETPTEEKAKIKLSSEEMALAEYMTEKNLVSMDYLIQMEAMRMGKQNYFTHVRRGILEAVKEDGIIKAVKEQFKAYKLDEQGFNILDRSTGEVLAYDKWFKFAMHRTGKLKPTQNVVKAFLTYQRTFLKKQALDETTPLIDIYAHALTPKGMTKKGLLLHGNLIKFVKEWINTQKGRHITLIAKQNGKIDAALRAIKMFTSLRDLAFNIPVSVATEVGEQITTYQLLGKRQFFRGKIRQNTKQGKKIIEK
jgi:predicted GNAT family acetyltransferase